jgi:hypothetical protein
MSLDVARDTFIQLMKLVPSVYIVVDALDESDDGVSLAEELSNIMAVSPTQVKIIITSRPESDIRRISKTTPQIFIEEADTKSDVELFIADSIHNSEGLEYYGDDVKQNLINRLIDKAGNMFLYAKLVMQDFEEPHAADDVNGMFNSLPGNLGGIYEKILKRIDGKVSTGPAQVFAKTIFRYLAFSYTPLRLDQMQQVLANHNSRSILHTESAYENIRHQVVRLCGSLVEVRNDGTVQVVHLSVKEFLSQNSILFPRLLEDQAEAHYQIYNTCMSYLTLPDFRAPLWPHRYQIAGRYDIVSKHPFLEYASLQWPSHLQLVNDEHRSAGERELVVFIKSKQCLTGVEAVVTISGDIETLWKAADTLRRFNLLSGDEEAVAVSPTILQWVESFMHMLVEWEQNLLLYPNDIHFIVSPYNVEENTFYSPQELIFASNEGTHLRSDVAGYRGRNVSNSITQRCLIRLNCSQSSRVYPQTVTTPPGR